MARLNRLGKIRRRTKPAPTLKQVARFYRGGVSTQLISQVETSEFVSGAVEQDYMAALSAAITAHREAKEILTGMLEKETVRVGAASSSAD
jgi:hypothetical protein